MDYKGYKIIAEVDANHHQQWEFEEQDGEIFLDRLFCDGGVGESIIEYFIIKDKKGERLQDYPDTLLDAKAIIDKLVEAQS